MSYRFYRSMRPLVQKIKLSSREKNALEFVSMCLIGGSVGLLVSESNIISIIDVHGQSMEPTLKSGQSVLLLKISKNFKKGDIIVCEDPEDPNEKIIKRIAKLKGKFRLLKDSS